MNFAEVLTKKFLITYEGRISRRQYWAYLILFMPIMFCAFFVAMQIDRFMDPTAKLGPFFWLIGLIWSYPHTCVTIKRWHDRNRSGWWVLAQYASTLSSPIALWFLVELLFLNGDNGGLNRYGADPLTTVASDIQ